MVKFKFADIGEGLTEGTVGDIKIKVGDKVKDGDEMFSVETDKVNTEIFAPCNGVITAINMKPGDVITVGQVVVEIDDGNANQPSSSEAAASVVGSVPVSNDVLPPRTIQQSQPIAVNNQNDDSITYEYDVIVVGAGPGGYVCAIKSAQEGLKTLIIEKEYYGGVCLNVGCIPTKALLKSSKVYDMFQHAELYGLELPGNIIKKVVPNWGKMQERKEQVVKKLTLGVEGLLKKNKITMVKGEAQALDSHTIEVAGKKYTTKNIIIATGSKSKMLPLPGFDDAAKSGYLISSTEALTLPKIPKKLIIIGGGVIGIEFAGLYRRLGTHVTILQGLDTILEVLDKDVREEMTKILIRNKVTIETSVKIKEIKNQSVVYENKDGKTITLESDYCLLSVGRAPILTGFENIGLKINERKTIEIDHQCRTNISNIYAIGDVTGKSMLAHVASAHAIIAIDAILGHDEGIDYKKVPACIYTYPEVATVGITEDEAKKNNIVYKSFVFPLAANGKAIADSETDGFIKIICDPKYGEILGAHIISSTATDMISEITLCMEMEGTIYDLGRTIHPHPTISEAVMEVANALQGHRINF